VYNLGGGKENSISILEAFALAEQLTGLPQVYSYVDDNRIGDHICYYSNLHKLKLHYPQWNISKNLETTFSEIISSWRARL
jgi:CDP-paratose 2-epimerase